MGVVVTLSSSCINVIKYNYCKIINERNDMNCKVYLERLLQINHARAVSLYTARSPLSQ